MAIAVVVEFPGATAEQYDQVIEKLGLKPAGPRESGPALPLGQYHR